MTERAAVFDDRLGMASAVAFKCGYLSRSLHSGPFSAAIRSTVHRGRHVLCRARVSEINVSQPGLTHQPWHT